jgi:hypothetical protein
VVFDLVVTQEYLDLRACLFHVHVRRRVFVSGVHLHLIAVDRLADLSAFIELPK